MNQKQVKPAQRGEVFKIILISTNPNQTQQVKNTILNDKQIQFPVDIKTQNAALAQAAHNLQHSEKFNTDILTSIRHDLKSVLNSVRESICLILDGVVDPTQDSGKKMLEMAKRNADRLNALINDRLNFSKLQDEQKNLHAEPGAKKEERAVT